MRRPAEVGLTDLLRLRNSRVYFTGTLLSLFGDNILTLAAGVWIKTLTGNDGAAGLTSFFLYGPALFFPFFGVCADRFRKRPMMLVINLVMALTVPWLLVVHDSSRIWVIYAILLVQGFAVVALASASSGLHVEMFPGPLLATANGFMTSLQEGLKVVAPTVGAALFVLVGGGGIGVIDAGTYAGALVALWTIRVDEPAPARSGGRAGLTIGLKYLFARAGLRRAALSACVVTLTGGLLTSALYGVLDTTLHRPPAYLGIVVAAQGAGSIVGGLLTGRLSARWGAHRLANTGIAVTALGTALLLVPAWTGVLAGNAIRGAGQTWVLVGVMTLMQQVTPREMIGRVSSSLYLIVFLPPAVAALSGALLIQLVDFRVLIAAAASACLFTATVSAADATANRPR
ncbi:MFS transporter [Actinoplanes sp. NPDC020271]|uniref:MFS transporter n=1 Tax=Actinoplanes sp. NPDC020271 TaxID=3363896 RepID=UPI0037B16E4A